MNKISVIVPVFNTEKYIANCIESILNQTYKNIEIICINDGSADNSLNIIKDYAKNNSNIICINFDCNKGVSSARNEGLKRASGDFITFVDSDDRIDNNYIESLADTIIDKDSDIVFNRNILSEQQGKLLPYSFSKEQLKIKDNTYINKAKDTHNIFFGVCSKIYKTDLIKKNCLYFPENHIYEDNFFHYTSFALADKIYFYKGPAYYYRKTENSITSKIKYECDKIINILGLVYDYYKQHNLLNTNIKIYFTMPIFNIDSEDKYIAFKNYFTKTKDYIMNTPIYNDLDKYFCSNVINTSDYDDYIGKYPQNAVISYIKRGK